MFLLFEVMDKHPSLPQLWGFCLILGVAGFFLARKNPLFLLFILPFSFVFSLLHLSEINDLYIGPAIILEAGQGYIWQSYLAMFIGTVLPLAGVFAWFRRRIKPLS